MNNPRERVLADDGSRSIDMIFSMTRTTGGAGVACCTFDGRVTILRILVCIPFCSSFSAQALKSGSSLFGKWESFGLKVEILNVYDYKNGFFKKYRGNLCIFGVARRPIFAYSGKNSSITVQIIPA